MRDFFSWVVASRSAERQSCVTATDSLSQPSSSSLNADLISETSSSARSVKYDTE